jgi:hypothetical protein
MSASFGIVEEKLDEADFFLNEFRSASPLSPKAKYSFSAFVSAARSATLVLQWTMKGVPGFDAWYATAQTELKSDPLARFFVEIRNDSVHKGLNPLNQVPIDHLREFLTHQLQHRRSHVIVFPSFHSEGSGELVDAVQKSSMYFSSLIALVFDCYTNFRCVVDPKWYFTQNNFSAMSKTLEDAVAELGFPPAWASAAPAGDAAWRVLRLQQPSCQLNDLFGRYLGREFVGPDDSP